MANSGKLFEALRGIASQSATIAVDISDHVWSLEEIAALI